MKPKSPITLGGITFITDNYTKEEIQQYRKSLRKSVKAIFDEHVCDDVFVVFGTPFGNDARVVYRTAVLDKDGKTITKPSNLSIYEIENTGELPPNRTMIDWEIVILEHLQAGINTPSTKKTSLTNVNELIKGFRDSDPAKKEVKRVVINNTEPRLVSSPLPSEHMAHLVSHFNWGSSAANTDGPSDPRLVPGNAGDIVQTPKGAGITTVASCDPSPLSKFQAQFETNVSYKQPWCKDGHLWQTDNTILIADCHFCQTTRVKLKRFFSKIATFFSKK